MAKNDSLKRPELSSANRWASLAPMIAWEARLATRMANSGRLNAYAYEFLRFGIKQAWACMFGGLVLALLLATKEWWPHHAALARYDALAIGCIAIQAAMLALKFERLDEARLIFAFHVIGTAMEVFKTAVGSWTYPEASVLRIGGVPLFSGFMYAAVGSYLARVWRLFGLRFSHHPGRTPLIVLCCAIYANFFADHWGIDLRIPLLLATIWLFRRTVVYFVIWRRYRAMPLLLGFTLVALFIWAAENIATYAGAWAYPGQLHGWHPVGPSKLLAWIMLMLISYTLVALDVGTPARPKREDLHSASRAARAIGSPP